MIPEPTFWAWAVAIGQNLAASFIGVLAGLAFAHLYREREDRKKFGGWQVIVIKDGAEEVNRAISVAKAKEILEEPAEKSVFLKGVVSPYGWIKCDLIKHGKELGVLDEDYAQRRITINLDRDRKPPRQPSNAEIMEALRQIAQHQGLTLTAPQRAGVEAAQTQEGG